MAVVEGAAIDGAAAATTDEEDEEDAPQHVEVAAASETLLPTPAEA
jgi:hypothetical protein